MKAGIAGAGILGQLLALSLHNAGWEVTLFDRDEKNNCSNAAAGLLTPVAELEKNELIIFQLGEEALKLHWPVILKQLAGEIYFRQTGSIVLAHPRDQVDLSRFIQLITNKLPAGNYYQQLKQDEIKHLEPDITRFQQGYYFPGEGQIDNQKLLAVLKKYLIAHEVMWLPDTRVAAVQPGKIILADKTCDFDLVCDCRGLDAKDIFKDLRSVRGELIWLHAPDVSITRPVRFLHPRYSLYIVPRAGQIYLIGASEIESEDFSPISVRTTLELLTAAYCVQGNFSEARIIKTETQCRPTLPDHLPAIKYADGFIAVNGLYRHGFLIAPTLIAEIMQWLELGTSVIRHPQLWGEYVC